MYSEPLVGSFSGIISYTGAPIGDVAEHAVLLGPPYASEGSRFVFRAPGVLLVQHVTGPSSAPGAGGLEDANHVIIGHTSDVAPVLDTYRRFGDECAAHLDGDFAFAIWDKDRRRLFAAVDHFGARPLFYSDGHGLFVFASDMGVITATGLTARRFNVDAILEPFLRDYSGATYDADVRALPGGSALSVTAPAVRERKYWQLQAAGKYRFRRDEEWADCLRELIVRAVGKRLDTDRPVGALLSGGLDSSFVVAVASKVLEQRNKPLLAFSNALPEGHVGPEKDERQWIDLLGRHLPNLEQRWIVSSQEVGPFTDLNAMFARTHAVPNPFHYMDRAQCEAAQGHGVGLLLSGHGGDFTVSYRGDGPSTSRWHTLRHQLAWRLPFARRLYQDWRDARDIDRELQLEASMKRALLERGYYRRMTHRERLARYVGSGSAGIHFSQLHTLGRHYGLDYGMPIWDREIVEFYMDVPPAQFDLDGTRRSLARRAMAGLVPDEIRARTDKTAFAPDFFTRFRRQENDIRALLQSPQQASAWTYVDRDRLRREVDDVLSMSKPAQARKVLLCSTLFVVAFVAWLQARRYEC